MKVLLDHNLPKQLKPLLAPHDVYTAREMRWDALANGKLLAVAEQAGFHVLVTGDQNLSYQQNDLKRTISLVVLSGIDRKLLIGRQQLISIAIGRCTPGSFEVVVIPSQVKATPAVE